MIYLTDRAWTCVVCKNALYTEEQHVCEVLQTRKPSQDLIMNLSNNVLFFINCTHIEDTIPFIYYIPIVNGVAYHINGARTL